MQRVLLIALASLIMLPAGAQTRARMLIGVSGYSLVGDDRFDSETVHRLAGGGGLTKPITDWLAIRTELRYTIQGGRFGGTIPGQIDGEPVDVPVEATFDLTYLEIPAFLVLGADVLKASRVEFGVGPAFGLKVDTRSRFAAASGVEVDQSLDAPGRISAWAASIDYLFPYRGERLLLGLRAWRSTTRAGLESTVPGADDLRTQGLTLVSGLVF